MDLKREKKEVKVPTARPWVEKYRPNSLAEIESQEEVVNALAACVQRGAGMPHLLFHGPPGTGKTTAILAVARELFGPDYVNVRVRELNASDDRGIQVVREKVKMFAQGAVGNVGAKVQSDGRTYLVPAFKLIILDEADALLPDAQAALRRMMEDFSDVTRFCILCNYVSRIIDPIASRCAKYRFKPLIKDALYRRIQVIASEESLHLSAESLQALDKASGGDLRTAIMFLQSAARAHGPELSGENFVVTAGLVPEDQLDPYVKALCAKDIEATLSATKMLVHHGFSAAQITSQLHQYFVGADCPLGSADRGLIALQLCETEKRLSDGGDDYLQLLNFGVTVCGA